jgi:hypothetical protein
MLGPPVERTPTDGGAAASGTVTGLREEAGMDRTGFGRWLDEYVAAWRANKADAIGALFSPDARYFYGPFTDPAVGRDAIVKSWLENPDDPASWQATYRPLAVDGDTFVATGESTYLQPDGVEVRTVYSNIFVCRFDDQGRCREFREWFMERPKPT